MVFISGWSLSDRYRCYRVWLRWKSVCLSAIKVVRLRGRSFGPGYTVRDAPKNKVTGAKVETAAHSTERPGSRPSVHLDSLSDCEASEQLNRTSCGAVLCLPLLSSTLLSLQTALRVSEPTSWVRSGPHVFSRPEFCF